MKPNLPPDVREKLEEISGKIRTPQEELVSMILHVGIEALAGALKRDGKVELPLTFEIAPPGYRSVFIREPDYLQLVRAGELVGLEDPANAFVADLIANAVDDPGNLLELVEAVVETQREEKLSKEAGSSETAVETGEDGETWAIRPRAERESIVRYIARQVGMDEDELVRNVILR